MSKNNAAKAVVIEKSKKAEKRKSFPLKLLIPDT